MPGHLFEYATIRIVPRVEREEFINVGVVLYCASQKFLQVKYKAEPERLRVLSENIDVQEIDDYLQAFEKICAGANDGGPIARLPMAERFRWLTATRSTIVQTSRVHPGLCEAPGDMLDRLFHEMVL